MRLRIATLNVWALPLGLARDTGRRLRAIGALLERADVWAFQEVWTGGARRSLSDAARHLHVVHGGGGLLVASRFPLEQPRFQAYALRGIATHLHRGDYAGGKGFLRVVAAGPDGPLTLVTTHLHAQYDPDGQDPYHAHRTGQVVELASDLRDAPDPLIALGDFNVREGRPEHRVLLGLSGLRDTAVELDRREPTSSSGTRIDYVFLRGGLRAVALERLEGYSDHAGLVATLEPGPARRGPLEPAAGDLARPILAEGLAAARARRTRDRLVAAGAAGTGLAAVRWTRRRFVAASLALPFAGGFGVSAEVWVPGEVGAFERVAAML